MRSRRVTFLQKIVDRTNRLLVMLLGKEERIVEKSMVLFIPHLTADNTRRRLFLSTAWPFSCLSMCITQNLNNLSLEKRNWIYMGYHAVATQCFRFWSFAFRQTFKHSPLAPRSWRVPKFGYAVGGWRVDCGGY